MASTAAALSGFTASLRSEEHTSELQSPCNLVCRLLLEKKKTNNYVHATRVPPSAKPPGPTFLISSKDQDGCALGVHTDELSSPPTSHQHESQVAVQAIR